MKIRIVQWNISFKSKPLEICKLMNSMKPDFPVIFHLNEVQKSAKETILNELNPDSSAYSLDLRPPGKNEGKNRKLGVLVLAFECQIVDFSLLERTVFPERSLNCTFKYNNNLIQTVAFHSLTGVGYNEGKPANFATIADFLSENDNIDFLCFDANEPKEDNIDPAKRVFWGEKRRDKGKKAALILGGNPAHHLTDSYSDYLQEKNEILSDSSTSYITGKTKRRYDHLYKSNKWQPINVEYRYEEAVKATSDHAILFGDFQKVK